MKNVYILIPESSVMQAIADPRYLFTAVNNFMAIAGQAPLFNVQLVGARKEIKLSEGLFSVFPDKLITETNIADLVIIPALFGNMPMAVQANKELVPWIRQQYDGGAEVASLCVGAFLLADTGLLDGRQCSTHWGFGNELKTMYPQVDITDGSIVTDENRLYTSGGANSYWNLLLYLLEKYTNRETAVLASKYFAIDINRSSQAAFAIFKGQKQHADTRIMEAQEYIEQNYTDRMTVDELADRFAIGRRTFERRFRSATNNTVVEYMQRVKIEAAKRSFESSLKNINEVMYDVGYTDTKAFRTIFKRITGLTPIEYRNKYNKMAISASGLN